jgi:carboxyl-terminal processing protease
MVSVALLAVLCFQLPGSLAQRDDDYTFVRTLVDIHRQIATNYVEDVDEAKLKERAIEGMMADLDPFSNYVPPARQEDFDRMLDASFKGIGIQLDMQDGKPIVVTPIDGSPAFKAGVMAGDSILKVNGESVEGLLLPDIIKKITGPIGTQVKVTVQHTTGQEVELTMTREEIVLATVKGYQRKQDDSWDWYVLDNPKVGYIRVTQFTENTFDEMHAALVGSPAEPGKPAMPGMMETGLQGLILDLRFNPGGRLDQAIKVLNMFVKDGVLLSTKGRNRPEQIMRADGQGTLPNFPMIVLVNEHSASAAEIVSGSLKDNHRALVIGTRSYGKGSVQELIPLEGNEGELKLTVAYYYLPSGRLVHKKTKDQKDWGVEPNVSVPMDDVTERKVLEMHVAQETIRKPIPKPTTRSAAPATQPDDEPVDVQLQQAVNTMVGLIILGQPAPPPGSAKMATTSTTSAASNPVTLPAENTGPVAPPTATPGTSPTTAP